MNVRCRRAGGRATRAAVKRLFGRERSRLFFHSFKIHNFFAMGNNLCSTVDCGNSAGKGFFFTIGFVEETNALPGSNGGQPRQGAFARSVCREYYIVGYKSRR
ncbi:hypothetical protein ISCGN_011449 [Ixodes scapularis]